MKKESLSLKEIALFAMLGAMMFGAQVAMEAFPNIHLSGMFTVLFTLLFRKKALIPIYLYVFLIGVRWGFGIAWIPYLYLWGILWAFVMLVPSTLSHRWKRVVYPIIGAVFGLLFGTLYAPCQALLFGLNFRQTLLWILAGLPWDVIHAVGNGLFCIFAYPLSERLKKVLVRMGI